MSNESTIDLADMAANVARGAAECDRNFPGWAEKIDPFWLRMQSCSRCVLGQISTEYIRGLRDIHPEGVTVDEYGEIDLMDCGHDWAIRHGFNLPDDSTDEDFWSLTAFWRAEIRKRTEATS